MDKLRNFLTELDTFAATLLYQKLNFEDHDDLKMFLNKSNNNILVSALNQLGALRKKHFDFEIETLEDETQN